MLKLSLLTPKNLYDLLRVHNGTFLPYAAGILEHYYDKGVRERICANYLYFLAALIPEQKNNYMNVASTGYGVFNDPKYEKCKDCSGENWLCPQYSPVHYGENSSIMRFLKAKCSVLKKNGLTLPKDDP